MTRDKAITFACAVLIGIGGALVPGCYADWRFVRNARNQVEPQLVQQIKALQDENAKLKAQGKPQ